MKSRKKVSKRCRLYSWDKEWKIEKQVGISQGAMAPCWNWVEKLHISVFHCAIVLCKSSSLGFPSNPIGGGLSSSYLRFNGEMTTWEFLWNKKCLRLKVRWSTENFLGYGGGVVQVFLSRQDPFPLLSPSLLLDKRDFLQLASSFRFKQGLLQHHFATDLFNDGKEVANLPNSRYSRIQ